MATPKLTRQNVSEPPIPLNVYIHRASTPGIGTLSTLIVGEESAVLIDVPLLNEDAKSFVAWIKEKTNVPISAIFVSHHHPDHYWSNDIIRAAWPAAKLYAAPYICDDINREIEAKKPFLISWLKDRVSQNPTMPEPYPFSFFVLKGNPSSPIVIMGPVQGDCINSTIFWLPVEKVVVCGDTMFGRNTHVWCEEIESTRNLQAWDNVITLIESLRPETLVVGHMIEDLPIDIEADIAHSRSYLEFFRKNIWENAGKMSKKEIIDLLQKQYPNCDRNNWSFFMNGVGNHFGNDVSREPAGPPYSDPLIDLLHHNRIHKAGEKSAFQLEGFII